jgi:hypothetical protein
MPVTAASPEKLRASSALAVFLLSVAAALLFWSLLPSGLRENENRDYFSFYRPVAERILAGEGATLPDGSPATLYPPGYPLFLAIWLGIARAIGASPQTLLRLTTLAATGISAVLLHDVAGRIWGRRAAFSTALLWSTYPFALWLTKQPNSEVPFVALFFGAWALFWKGLLEKSRSTLLYFLVGVLLGLSMLLRPIALGTGLLLAAMLCFWPRQRTGGMRLALAAALLCGNLAVVLPWEGWVFWRSGRVILLSTGGVPSMLDGLTFAVDRKTFRQGVRVPRDVEGVMREIQGNKRGIVSVRDVASLLAAEFRAHPQAVSKLFAIKAARSWYATNSERFEGAILALQILYAALVLAGIFAASRGGGAGGEMALAVLLMAGYFWAMTVSTLSLLRYMIPAIGLLFIPVSALFVSRRVALRESLAQEERQGPAATVG